MPSFYYSARTPSGDIQTGAVEASSQESAIDILQQHKLIITEIRQSSRGTYKGFSLNPFRNRIKHKDVVSFSRQVSVLLGADIPLLETLRSISEETVNPNFAQVLRSLASDVNAGVPLSEALEKYPKLFNSLYVNLVRSGEVSGKLSEIFSYLSSYLERQFLLMSKLRGAFYYPAFVLVVLGFVMGIVVLYVLPNIQSLFVESNVSLPLPTRIVLGFSSFVRDTWWVLLLILAGGVFAFQRILSNPVGRYWYDHSILRVPVVGKMMEALAISRFADNLSTLISSGVPIVQAVEIVATLVGNMAYSELLADMSKALRRGEKLHVVLQKSSLMPPSVAQMIAVGEKSGHLDTTLKYVANFYQRDVEQRTDALLALIEPALIVLLGLGVGIFVAAVLLPIYNLSSVI